MALIHGSANARRAKVGDVIKGRYQILSLIGKGGMSRVYLATDRELTNKQWAIKEVDRSATDPMGRPIEQSLANEARLLSALDHPNIVRIVDTVKTDDFIYVVMDHVEGQTLAELVRRSGKQSEADVQRWMLQVCDALSYLHRQNPPIIYRDMKPSNVMLHPDGYIKLIDLGVAREFKDDARKDTIAFGTVGYAAPEQYGKAQTDARADIYGVGATMWHLLAGEEPPAGELPDVRTKSPDVSEGFAEVIIPKCCRYERDRRYQSADELAADLEIYEELTQDYRSTQLGKVRRFAITAAAGALSLVVGVSCLGARELTLTQNYEHEMSVAASQVQSNTAAAEEAYEAAIGYRPNEIDPYLGLIDCYEVDGKFDETEKAQLDDVYQSNLESINASRKSELNYEIGKLYWYFYSYGSQSDSADDDSNRATRIKASADYFKSAAADESFENVEKAKVYDGIATFTTEIASAVKTDDDDAEMYRTYWDDLVALARQTTQESGDVIRLDGYALVTNAMETYMDKFKDAGVTKTEAEELQGVVREGLEDMSLASGSDEAARRDEILGRLQAQVSRKIATVYSGAVVGVGSGASSGSSDDADASAATDAAASADADTDDANATASGDAASEG